eukprot:TRINITY_DN11018_c0_g1_i1.p1 TRINITY_DN11018_c0_g1~~TRINITY_DN11018_c0_g1_i1.p1  ORF type:complete len:344 (+),score=23.29 TRINITY_DN11018_c0_g1_i1:63-1034(+)
MSSRRHLFGRSRGQSGGRRGRLGLLAVTFATALLSISGSVFVYQPFFRNAKSTPRSSEGSLPYSTATLKAQPVRISPRATGTTAGHLRAGTALFLLAIACGRRWGARERRRFARPRSGGFVVLSAEGISAASDRPSGMRSGRKSAGVYLDGGHAQASPAQTWLHVALAPSSGVPAVSDLCASEVGAIAAQVCTRLPARFVGRVRTRIRSMRRGKYAASRAARRAVGARLQASSRATVEAFVPSFDASRFPRKIQKGFWEDADNVRFGSVRESRSLASTLECKPEEEGATKKKQKENKCLWQNRPVWRFVGRKQSLATFQLLAT